MGKLKFTLSNIIFWVSLAASCLLLENVAFLTNNVKGGLSDTHFFMLFVLAFGGYLAYFLVEHIKNHASIDYFLVSILGIAFICGMIAIFTFKSVSFTSDDPAFNFTYSQDYWQQTKHALSFLIFLLTVYAILFFFNKNYPSVRKIRIIYFIIVVICAFAIIYSLIAEYDIYVFNLTTMPSKPKSATSIFWNANMFSCFLLLGIASCIGLNVYKKNALSYICIFSFAVMIVLVGSLTAIIVSFSTLLIYFLFEIIMTIKKRVGLGLFFLALYLMVITSAVVIYASALKYDLGTFSNFCRYLHNGLRAADYATLTLRTFTWGSSIEFMGNNPLNLIFGLGFRNSDHVIGGFWFAYRHVGWGTLSAHSGYVQVLMNFGVVGVVIYFLFVVYYFYCFIRLMKSNARFALLFGVMGASILAYGVMESVIFFNPNTMGILVGTAFFLPMINKWKHIKHHQLGDQVVEVEKPQLMEPALLSKSIAKVIMSLIAVDCSFFAFPHFLRAEHSKYLLINTMVLLVILLFTLPSIISSLATKSSRKVFISACITNFLLIFGGFATLCYFYLSDAIYSNNDSKWVYPVLLIIVLVGEVIIFSTAKRRSFSDYLQGLIGASKNSFMGLIGVAGVAFGAYFLTDKIDTHSLLTYIIYPFIGFLAYYTFSYFVPFKDTRAIVDHYNSLCLYSLKKDVLKDRLGYYNDKRKD